MAPPLYSLYTLSFALALLVTLFVAASLRLLTILPNDRAKKASLRQQPTSARVLIVLGSGGHTHEMFALLRDLDTRRYVHRTYVVSSGDSFSAQRAVVFEKQLEERAAHGTTGERESFMERAIDPQMALNGERKLTKQQQQHQRPFCVGPGCFTITTVPRARRVHQPLYTTPFSALRTLLAAFKPLLSTPHNEIDSGTSYSKDVPSLPTLIITNGPATAVILIFAAFVLRFFNIRGAERKRMCRTVYVESFARVKTLSLSGTLLVWVVDRFLVQWEGIEG